MSLNPLSSAEALFWDLRRRGLGFAEIGRRTGVTRQAVYKALLKADEAMAKAFWDTAETYKIDLVKVDPKRGMASGYSHALRSRVVLVYSPDRGILVWYEESSHCRDCEKREECLEIIEEEAHRLGSTRRMDPDKEPAELAEELFRGIWPEGFD